MSFILLKMANKKTTKIYYYVFHLFHYVFICYNTSYVVDYKLNILKKKKKILKHTPKKWTIYLRIMQNKRETLLWVRSMRMECIDLERITKMHFMFKFKYVFNNTKKNYWYFRCCYIAWNEIFCVQFFISSWIFGDAINLTEKIYPGWNSPSSILTFLIFWVPRFAETPDRRILISFAVYFIR